MKKRDITPTEPTKLDQKPKILRTNQQQTFLTKGKQPRPTTAQPPKGKATVTGAMKTNETQDESLNLQKILSFYRDKVEAHEKDRHLYIQKMEALRVKQDNAH